MDEQDYALFGRSAFGSVSNAKFSRILQFSGPSILDVGCGPGLYIEKLISHGYQVTGVEGNSFFVQEALKFTDQVFQIDLDRNGLSQFSDASFDTVIMLDIIEHLVDDYNLLSEAARVAKKRLSGNHRGR